MSRELLDAPALEAALTELPQWRSNQEKLERTFVFESFVEAFSWMGRGAEEAERLDHHPQWSNVYNRVSVSLWTHDRGGITDLDVRLARFMDDAAS